MARFKYVAYNKAGVRQESTMTADSEELARKMLESNDLIIVEIRDQQSNMSMFNLTNRSIDNRDVEFFTAEMALLLKSGLKLDRGLTILSQNVEKPALRELLESLLQSIKQGIPLSEALGKFKAFDDLYVGLVKIAEETGQLAPTFERLAAELKYQVQLAAKIKQALVYPGVILTVCLLALIFIFNFVVPNLTSLFSDEQNLPLYTVALLSLSDFMQNYQLYILFGFLFTGYSIYVSREMAWVRQLVRFCRESLPLVAGANLLVERIRFNAALATMLSAGIAVDKALKLAAGTLRTESLRFEVTSAIEQVRRGDGLAVSLEQTRIYPPYFASLLSIGEESGELEKVFNEIAERSRTQFYDWVTKFTNLLEPLLILIMGAIVGSVVVIMMLSITAVTDMEF